MLSFEELDLEIGESTILNINVLNKFIKDNFKYKAEYFYNDPMGSTFSNDDGWVIIAYGNDPEELAKHCEENGYRKCITWNDGGYIIKDITTDKNIRLEEG